MWVQCGCNVGGVWVCLAANGPQLHQNGLHEPVLRAIAAAMWLLWVQYSCNVAVMGAIMRPFGADWTQMWAHLGRLHPHCTHITRCCVCNGAHYSGFVAPIAPKWAHLGRLHPHCTHIAPTLQLYCTHNSHIAAAIALRTGSINGNKMPFYAKR